ncbi:MAG: hypothetical protein DRH08_00910 [Deltaproteobacteria bacterium]|nr:MAG: hypothetical protein DRH08_00910 [Deltaproteobacteria bacterium]
MADPRLRTLLVQPVNNVLLDRAIRHAVFLERFKTGQVNALVGFLNRDVFPEISRLVGRRAARIVARGVDAGPATTRRLRDLEQAIAGQLAVGIRSARDTATQGLRAFGLSEAEYQARLLSDVTKPWLDFDFTLPSVRTINSVVTARPMQGKIMRDWFKDVEQSTKRNINRAIGQGVTLGETNEQIVRRLRGTAANGFSDGVYQTTRHNARTTVRTSITHVSTHAREETFKANEEVVKGVQWVSTLDGRTTFICHPPGTRVSSLGALRSVFRRPYEGDLVLVRTASGKQLRATPNHPVLTSSGWRPIQEVQPGREVLYAVSGDGLCVACRDDVGVPPEIGKVADAALEGSACDVRLERATAGDFHGDIPGGDCEVHVASPNRHLMMHGEAQLADLASDEGLGLVVGPVPASGLLGAGGAPDLLGHGRAPLAEAAEIDAGGPEPRVERRLADAEGPAHVGRSGATLEEGDGWEVDVLGQLGLLPALEGRHDALPLEHGSDGRGRSAVMPCQGCGTLAVAVAPDDIVEMRVEHSGGGHVYGLETGSGLVVADGLVVHNCMSLDGHVFKVGEGQRPPAHPQCRSTTVPVLKSWSELGIPLKDSPTNTRAALNGQVPAEITYPKWFKRQPEAFQREVLGPGRFELYKSGKISLDRFVDSTGRTLNLGELRRLEGLGTTARRPRRQVTPRPDNTPKPAPKPAPRANPSGADTREAVAKATAAPEAALGKSEGAYNRSVSDFRESSSRVNSTIVRLRQEGVDRVLLHPDYIAAAVAREKAADAVRAAQEAVEASRAAVRKAALPHLRVSNPATVTYANPETIRKARNATAWKKRSSEAREFVEAVLSMDAIDKLGVEAVRKRRGTRAFARVGQVHMPTDAATRVWVHEIGHTIEMADDNIRRRCNEFLWARGAADKRGLRRLRAITGNRGYGPSELAWEDKFVNAYIGKDYRPGAIRGSPAGKVEVGVRGPVTEVLSMGIELLYADPAGLARKDPAMFDLIVDILRGASSP